MMWTQERLNRLEQRDGFYHRGEVMTRIEVFSDAAFAFAVTMLVISLDTIPENFDQLLQALRRVPAFAASFAILVVIWLAHRRWSQRFGLDDTISTW